MREVGAYLCVERNERDPDIVVSACEAVRLQYLRDEDEHIIQTTTYRKI